MLTCALEAALAQTPMEYSHWPVVPLFASGYLLFSWDLYRRKGVFFYPFLDPSKLVGVLAHLLVLALMRGLFYGCAAFNEVLRDSLAGRFAIILAALSVCAWR